MRGDVRRRVDNLIIEVDKLNELLKENQKDLEEKLKNHLKKTKN